MALSGTVKVVSTADELAAAAATWIVDLAADAIAERGRFSIALAGGNTPRALYEKLADARIASAVDWAHWIVGFGDERAVEPTDKSSNFAMATDELLSRVPIPAEQVLRMRGEMPDLDAAARNYAAELINTLGEPVRFDCVLLGLGENGHTASLFPGTAALEVRDALCTRGRADYEPFDRLTLTYPAINSARSVAFLVSGSGKGEALRSIAAGTLPAAGVNPTDGDLVWWLDADANATLAAS